MTTIFPIINAMVWSIVHKSAQCGQVGTALLPEAC